MKFLLLLFLLTILSCNYDKSVDNLVLFSGVSEITNVGSNELCFITNLKEYNNLMALCFINIEGELLQVHPIDKYRNIDVNQDFIKIIEHDGIISVIYEEKDQSLIIESYNQHKIIDKIIFKRDINSYGSLIQIGKNNGSAYIRSNKIYNINTHKNYQYNYFILNENLEKIDSGLIDLGEYFPLGMTILNGKIFYYIDDRQLFFKQIHTAESFYAYKFDSDIVDIKVSYGKMLVLLSDSIYVITKDGEVTKGFNLLYTDSEFRAHSILNSNDENLIIIELKSSDETIFKIFTFFGIQIAEYKLGKLTVGDTFFYYTSTGGIIAYSINTTLYLKDF